ncbi:transporter substrate-binding domain-containing protein [Trichothermofontia sichuanensis B231]|uniref:transporter substrate-binding domain-containing protein n=1 Tax=Trichothermofontia sichuanensis TaxID=3045816 RepID=UPI0022477E88|nr:transporter substrate-binding domain-containing protein [Trichothermofontia sichuanensis]UZQ54300.1 transporter substrate-binding domain-containing protein [Trichothermofontia sichuanensis B231]
MSTPRLLHWLLAIALFLSWANVSRAAEWKTIRRRGHLIIGVKDNLRPLGFREMSHVRTTSSQEHGQSTGELQGLEIDIAHQLAQELLGKADAVVLKPVANRDRLRQILDNEVDLVIAQVTATPSRARVVAFSVPYYHDGTTLLVRAGTVQHPSQLTQGRIAVLNGSSAIAPLQVAFPQAQLLGVDSYQMAQRRLDRGEVIAIAADASVLTGWVQQTSDYQLLPIRLATAPLSVVLPKGSQYNDLRQLVNGAIHRWQRNGWLQERIQYWGLSLPDTHTSHLQSLVLCPLSSLLPSGEKISQSTR